MNAAYILVTPFFPSPTRWDGAYCLDFAKALKDAFLHLHLPPTPTPPPILVFVPGAGEDYEIEGVKVFRFPTRQLPSNIFPFLFRRYNERSFLKKVVEVLGGEVVVPLLPICHANTVGTAIYALAAKRAFGATAILHHHDLASFGLNTGILRHCWLNNVILYPILRKLIESMDLHVFCSEASRRSLLRVPDASWSHFDDYRRQFRGLGFYRSPRIKRSLILHNGVDASIFNRGREGEGVVGSGRAEESIIHSTTTTTHYNSSSPPLFTLGCIGNFQELKDQLTLLEAFRILRARGYANLRLRLLGGDSTLGRLQRLKGSRSYLERCRQFVRDHDLGDSVEFLPEVRHEALPEFYRSLDLFVLPSYFEGFGCVYTEAYACGVPFIACEGQGIADILDESERTKWLCKVHDPEDLARLIERYYMTRDEQQLKSEIAIHPLVKRFVEEFS